MPKTNRIERHAARRDIERLLANGTKLRAIEARYGIPIDALSRHRQKLERLSPDYFAAITPAEVPPDAQRLLQALAEISAAISRAAKILSA